MHPILPGTGLLEAIRTVLHQYPNNFLLFHHHFNNQLCTLAPNVEAAESITIACVYPLAFLYRAVLQQQFQHRYVIEIACHMQHYLIYVGLVPELH
jgi:hypothetical protein